MRAVSAPTVVIIAAGEGTRMRSALPKVLHPLCGRPLILWPVTAALQAGAGKVIVVDNPKRRLEDWLPEGVETAIQEQPNGTGDAVASAVEHIDDEATVDAFHAAALAAGATDNSEPGLRMYHPNYYGAFVHDPDGNNVEAVCHMPA